MIIIDRIEEQWAILMRENVSFKVPKDLLPMGAKEGDLLQLDIKIDQSRNENRREHIEQLMDDLFR